MIEAKPSLLWFQCLSLLFPDLWKYGMLALSIFLLLAALIIMGCQLCKCRKLKKSESERILIKEAQKWRSQENGFLGRRLQAPPLGFRQWPCHAVKIKRIQKKLKKLGICFSPPSTISNLCDMGFLANETNVPDQCQGKLRFSLLYNKKHLELLLTVVGVLDLPSQECTNTFVQVRLLSWAFSQSPELQHIVQEWQTQVIKNGNSPTFGDQFTYTLQEAELTKSSIKLEVKHFDRHSRHIPLGEVRVALNTLSGYESMEFCEELCKVTKDIVGEVLVSLKCLPISQRIEVGLLKVKTALLFNSPEKWIYARIDVFGNLHKQKHQKSKSKVFASVTVFNETFLFHLPEPVVWDCAILISIYKIESNGRQLVGQAALGKQGSDNHWDCMMQSIQQPVAKWHSLLI